MEAAAELLNARRTCELEHASQGRAAAFAITAYEGGKLHWPELKRRADQFEPLSRDRLLAGAMMPEQWVQRAHRFRRYFMQEVARMFEQVDVVIAPATPRSATPIGAMSMTVNGQDMIPRAHMGMLTQPISFVGLPVVVAPFILPGSMPVGVQIIAPAWREDWCLRVGRALELLSADFGSKPPAAHRK